MPKPGSGSPFSFSTDWAATFLSPLGLLRPPHGIRLIAFGCRGHGQAPLGDPADLTFETLAGDWLALLRHLGKSRTIAGGISMGAALALHLALYHPEHVRALILVRPAWLDGPLPADNRAT